MVARAYEMRPTTRKGLKGLAKDKASGRKAAVQAAMKSLKGKLEIVYFTPGSDDVVLIVEARTTSPSRHCR
jgi:uncharacterized protein with GYD domain